MAEASGATYGNRPDTSELDAVRLLIGDTDCANALLLDTEIQFYIEGCGSSAFAAPRAAEAIAGKFARQVTIRTGGVSKSNSDLMQHYLDLAKRLDARAAETGGAPIFTAMTKDDKRTDRLDPSLVQPQFRIGQDDNPRKATVVTPDEILNPNP
jgi:hypothetical protein